MSPSPGGSRRLACAGCSQEGFLAPRSKAGGCGGGGGETRVCLRAVAQRVGKRNRKVNGNLQILMRKYDLDASVHNLTWTSALLRPRLNTRMLGTSTGARDAHAGSVQGREATRGFFTAPAPLRRLRGVLNLSSSHEKTRSVSSRRPTATGAGAKQSAWHTGARIPIHKRVDRAAAVLGPANK